MKLLSAAPASLFSDALALHVVPWAYALDAMNKKKWKPHCLTPTQHNDLLPKHEGFCFQRRSRSKQIDDEPKYKPDETRHSAHRGPILYVTPTGFNLRYGQV